MKALPFQYLKSPGNLKVCLYISFIVAICSCDSHSGFDYPKDLPEDFEFKAIWHFEGSVIDSSEGTFRQAISYDSDTTISFTLTKTQKAKIYQIVKDIDVFGYPEDFEPPTTMEVLPSSGFYLEVQIRGVRKRINWKENVYSSTKRAKRLRHFFDHLDELLDASAEIQALPKDDRAFF
ncbi:MAG: hypothetical protein HEP71_27455 [Roseivirga sp.]|nr:hypothetical protein [Roseivirga sp.]